MFVNKAGVGWVQPFGYAQDKLQRNPPSIVMPLDGGFLPPLTDMLLNLPADFKSHIDYLGSTIIGRRLPCYIPGIIKRHPYSCIGISV